MMTKHNAGGYTNGCRCPICKDAHNRYMREWYKKGDNKAKVANSCRMYKHGVTPDEFCNMIKQQKGCCLICGKKMTIEGPNSADKVSIDHDHETGETRGLLCSNCNRGLGYFSDSIEIVQSAADYLRDRKCL